MTNKIDFARDIRPLFERSCFKCHGPERPKSRFRLDERAVALRGGENGVDIKPGDSAHSPLIHFVAGLVEDMQMPPEKKAPPLTPAEVAVLRAWIDQGAEWDASSRETFAYSLSPTARWYFVEGNAAKFREHHWGREGWGAGAEQFEYQEKIGRDGKFKVEGHAVRDDYQVAVTLERNELGFIRGGFEQFRKYYSDAGGYHPNLTPPSMNLDRDLHLDTGRAWIDFGLTLPDWPKLVLGYEYQSRHGVQSTLRWGDSFQGADSRKTLPAAQDIDERVHVIKFDLDYETKRARIEDNFRGEFAELKLHRVDQRGIAGVLAVEEVREGYRHFEGANAFRAEKQFNDWFYGSAGHLYSKLNADTFFNLDTLNPAFLAANLNPFTPPYQQYRSQGIVLERESHVFNLNGRAGPWAGLTFIGGVQCELTKQTGLGRVAYELYDYNGGSPTLSPWPSDTRFNADLDKKNFEEHLELRYTRIPFTVLFAEARLQQESISQFEQQTGNNYDLLRQTEATSAARDYRFGFNTSPWRRISVNAHYRHRARATDYDHVRDEPASFPLPYAEGYSAFITARDQATDEVDAKVTLQPATWLKTTLGYKVTATEYRTTTDPVTGTTSGGQILAGNYDAHVCSFNATLTPWRRCYLSTTFSYQQTRTTTAANDMTSVVPWRGNVYSVMSSGNYTLNEKTDLNAGYSFSKATYGQGNFTDGLPYGLNYDLHGLQAGITRRYGKSISTKLQYGFYLYDEPNTGRVNNYTAHALFATLTARLP